MLVRQGERQRFDVQGVGVAQHAVEIEAQRMGRELGVQSREQAANALGMIDLDPKLLSHLAVDRFDDLACPVEGAAHRWGHLIRGFATRMFPINGVS